MKKTAVKNAVLTTLCIVGVGNLMYYGSLIKVGRNYIFLVPIALHMLFVMSASITGFFLFFGKPAQMYIDGKKKDALSLLTQILTFSQLLHFFQYCF